MVDLLFLNATKCIVAALFNRSGISSAENLRWTVFHVVFSSCKKLVETTQIMVSFALMCFSLFSRSLLLCRLHCIWLYWYLVL